MPRAQPDGCDTLAATAKWQWGQGGEDERDKEREKALQPGPPRAGTPRLPGGTGKAQGVALRGLW